MTGVLELTMTDDIAALRPASARALEEVTVRAVDLVVDAHGDLDVWYAIGTGALEGPRHAVVRFAHRAGVELGPDHRISDGLVAVPATEAVELCRAFSRRQRGTVLHHLLAEERRIARGAPAAGGAHTAGRARALVRAWADGAA
jgi:hypothetical protein